MEYPYPLTADDGTEQTAPPNLPVTATNIYSNHPDLPPGTYATDDLVWPETINTDYTVPLTPAATPPIVIPSGTPAVAFNVLEIERPTRTVDALGAFSCLTQTETTVMTAAATISYTAVMPENATVVEGPLPTDVIPAFVGNASLTAGTWSAVPTLVVDLVDSWILPFLIFAPIIQHPSNGPFELPGSADVLAASSSTVQSTYSQAVPTQGSSGQGSSGQGSGGQGSSGQSSPGQGSSGPGSSGQGSAVQSSPGQSSSKTSTTASFQRLTVVTHGTIIVTDVAASPTPVIHQQSQSTSRIAQSPGGSSSGSSAPVAVNGESPAQQSGIQGGQQTAAPAQNPQAVGNPASSKPTQMPQQPAQVAAQNPSPITQAPITIAGATLTPTSTSVVFVDGQRLVPGGPAITVNSHTFSLSPTDSSIITVDSRPQPLPSSRPGSSPSTTSLTISDTEITLQSAPAYTIQNAGALVPDGQPVVLASGTTLSLGWSALAIITSGTTSYIGGPQTSLSSSDSPLGSAGMGAAIAAGLSSATLLPLLTLGIQTYTATLLANGETAFIIAGQTLAPGHAITATLPASVLATLTGADVQSLTAAAGSTNGGQVVLTILLGSDGQRATIIGPAGRTGATRTTTSVQTLGTARPSPTVAHGAAAPTSSVSAGASALASGAGYAMRALGCACLAALVNAVY